MQIRRAFKKAGGQYIYRHPVNGVNITVRHVVGSFSKEWLIDWVDTEGVVHRHPVFGRLVKALRWVEENINEEGELNA